jgi:hypothetical protein
MAGLASLRGLDVARGDLAFVGGEGGQDFGLFTLRDLKEIQGPSELRCDLIKFCRGNPEVPVGSENMWLSLLGAHDVRSEIRAVTVVKGSTSVEAGFSQPGGRRFPRQARQCIWRRRYFVPARWRTRATISGFTH